MQGWVKIVSTNILKAKTIYGNNNHSTKRGGKQDLNA